MLFAARFALYVGWHADGLVSWWTRRSREGQNCVGRYNDHGEAGMGRYVLSRASYARKSIESTMSKRLREYSTLVVKLKLSGLGRNRGRDFSKDVRHGT